VKIAAKLLDHLALPDDDLLQLVLHQLPVLGELLEDVVECLGTGCGRHAGDPS
jgi:hypothetical protein